MEKQELSRQGLAPTSSQPAPLPQATTWLPGPCLRDAAVPVILTEPFAILKQYSHHTFV